MCLAVSFIHIGGGTSSAELFKCEGAEAHFAAMKVDGQLTRLECTAVWTRDHEGRRTAAGTAHLTASFGPDSGRAVTLDVDAAPLSDGSFIFHGPPVPLPEGYSQWLPGVADDVAAAEAGTGGSGPTPGWGRWERRSVMDAYIVLSELE